MFSRVFHFWNGLPKVSLNFRLMDNNGEVKNMNSKIKGTFILGLILFAALASTFVLSASAADQTRDRIQDQTQDCDGTPDRTQDRARDRDCTSTFVKDQTQLQLRQQIRDC
jgi:hypothetical protein